MKKTAARVAIADRLDSEKISMLQFLAAGGSPDLVNADLDNETLFLGFNLASQSTLHDKIIYLNPRQDTLKNTELQLKNIQTYRLLKQCCEVAQKATPKLLLWFKLPWSQPELAELVWYSYFTDLVSIRFLETGGYRVMSREEMFNESPRAEHVEILHAERRGQDIHV